MMPQKMENSMTAEPKYKPYHFRIKLLRAGRSTYSIFAARDRPEAKVQQ